MSAAGSRRVGWWRRWRPGWARRRRHVHTWRVRWLWATDAIEYTCECGATEVIYPWQLNAQLLQLTAHGASASQIARRLDVSTRTIHRYRARIRATQ